MLVLTNFGRQLKQLKQCTNKQNTSVCLWTSSINLLQYNILFNWNDKFLIF